MIPEADLCICGEEAEKACLARRGQGLCPQLPVIKTLQQQLTWLTEAHRMLVPDFEFPEGCDADDFDTAN